MSQLGMKLRKVGTPDGNTVVSLAHWCPGCRSMHAIVIDWYNSSGAKWTWDGNIDAPSFSPSINIRIGPRPTVPEGRHDAGRIDVCHYFIRAGKIEFLGDCTHYLKGQTVDLPDLPSHARDR